MRRSWSVTGGGYNGTTLTVTVEVYYGDNQAKTVSWPITIYLTGSCTIGIPKWMAWFTGTSYSTTTTTYATDETNTASVSVTVQGFCVYT